MAWTGIRGTGNDNGNGAGATTINVALNSAASNSPSVGDVIWAGIRIGSDTITNYASLFYRLIITVTP